ncbi:PREDICTED: RING finger protein 215 [Nipponia nippon]|uniref:RING finger protein 215 n=1 Tax=Nipponia nippon TaxID=128390 RepID=UPI00051171EC|nr:PREDICTED: RING finger protein 215 [Nipponia nippon]
MMSGRSPLSSLAGDHPQAGHQAPGVPKPVPLYKGVSGDCHPPGSHREGSRWPPSPRRDWADQSPPLPSPVASFGMEPVTACPPAPVTPQRATAARGGREGGRVGDAEPELGAADSWIGVVPVGEEPAEAPRGAKEESFTAAVVSKMKRALVLGASALLILALNQNAIRELDVSQLLAKPVIVIQSSDNVTKLLGALLRGLRATAKITYQAVLLENLGVTLTLWSTCGLSRGGLYGEWQGVICTGENSSQVQVRAPAPAPHIAGGSQGVSGSPPTPVPDCPPALFPQKYLQQLWNTILLIALLLCTGVIVQAQRQSRQDLTEQDAELDLKQHIRRQLLALKSRRYHPGKPLRSQGCEIDSCAVCLDQFHKSQWLRVLPCSHEFHRDCVDPWLLLQQTCPLCKRNILGNCCTES